MNLNILQLVSVNTPPNLQKPLPTLTLNTGTDFAVELPISSATDKEGDAITAKVQIDGSASKFLSFDNQANKLVVNGAAAINGGASGIYIYTVSLTDSKGLSSSYSSTV